MGWFLKFQLRPRFIASFGLVVVLVVFVGLAGLHGAATMQTQFRDTTRDAVPSIVHLRNTDSAVHEAMRDSRGAVIAGTGAVALQLARAATAIEAEAAAEFLAYERFPSGSPRERTLAAEVRRLLPEWRALDAKTVRLANHGGSSLQAAAQLSLGPEQAVAQNMLRDFDTLAMLNQADISAAEIRADQAHDDALKQVLAASALAAFLAIALGLLLARSIARPINALRDAVAGMETGAFAQLEAAMDKLARGDLAGVPERAVVESLPVRGRDELSQLAASFNGMTDAVTSIFTSLNGAREGLRSARNTLMTSNDALRASEERFKHIVTTAREGIWQLDAHYVTTFANQAMADMLGYTVAEMVGIPMFAFMDPEAQSAILAALREQVMAVQHEDMRASQFELRFPRKDGGHIWALVTVTYTFDDSGKYAGSWAILADITARKKTEDELQHRALYDTLTELPNRTLFLTCVQDALNTMQAGTGSLAVLLLDIDRFKEVNDTLGHANGDAVLREVASRLLSLAPNDACVSRLSGDEFAVLMPSATSQQAISLIRATQRELGMPYIVAGVSFEVEPSIGVVIASDHADDAQTLLHKSDVARSTAKRLKQGFAVYTSRHDTHSPERLTLLGELRRGIDQGQLFLVYQPQVRIADRAVCGVEALVRWQHPQRGLVSPDQFIGLAENTGAIRPLTLLVLDTAIKQCGLWRRKGIRLPVAVNLSARNLHDALLITATEDLLVDYQVPPDWLTLEVTESAVMEDPTGAMVMLTRLSNLGIRLEIDDFGTGYSSLGYLKKLPVHGLKVDRGFVQHLDTDQGDQAIVASTVALAHTLGHQVVAEGVETAAALDMLSSLGCDTAQGYYIGRPLSVEALESWLATSPFGMAPATQIATPA
jgi:diguanylate cyclase (GGDEF)-like protein/PAS domain S-box-containing protein